jgi:GNAT superfamily N-acetyltransferase
MSECSVVKNLEIVEGGVEDYRRLSVYHYRDCGCGPYVAIYAMKAVGRLAGRMGKTPAGVIVYTMPVPGAELRNVALGGILTGLDRKSRLSFINKNIRTISRVIIEPRFRSLGLATRLVRETIELIDVPIIEALAVMGRVNNFFERAGLTVYRGQNPLRTVQLVEAFEFVCIARSELIDVEAVQRKMDSLSADAAEFIDYQIRCFLQCYGKRRNMQAGLERTRFVLSRLTEQPIYYIKIKKNSVERRAVQTEPSACGG